jgi:beta-lactamase regulating signal transducer with metallopeptidase domain
MNPSFIPIVDVAAKSAAVLLLAQGILSVWRGASASQRSLVWLLCFSTLLLLPLTTLMQPRWPVPVSETRAVVMQPAVPIEVVPSAPSEVTPTAAVAVTPGLSILEIVMLAWTAGVVLILGRRFIGSLRLRRLMEQTEPCADSRAQECLASIASELRLDRHVDLRTSDAVSVPMTWGTRMPVLLLPGEAVEWSYAELSAALRHEMGHIKHRDHLTRGIMTLACALYWFNPLVWLAARRWRTAQEQASDDLVVAKSDSAETYAMQLLNAARQVRQGGLLKLPVMTMAQPSTLELRLSAIMDADRNRQPVRRAMLWTGAGAVTGLFILCASLQLHAAEPEKSAQTVPIGKDGGQPDNKGDASGVKIVTHDNTTMLQRAEGIIIPTVQFRGATLKEAIEFFRVKSREADPAKKGVNIVLSADAAKSQARLTLDLKDVPLSEALRYTAALSELELRADAVSVILTKPAPGARALTPAVTPIQPAVPPVKSAALEKAKTIILPQVTFASASAAEAVEFFRIKAQQADPEKKGVNILLAGGSPPKVSQITLDLKDVPLSEALRYTAELLEMDLVAEDHALYLRTRPAQK